MLASGSDLGSTQPFKALAMSFAQPHRTQGAGSPPQDGPPAADDDDTVSRTGAAPIRQDEHRYKGAGSPHQENHGAVEEDDTVQGRYHSLPAKNSIAPKGPDPHVKDNLAPPTLHHFLGPVPPPPSQDEHRIQTLGR
ncbi:MAG: hypothetical protein Q9202_006875 [Teloschistes flavicans]